MRILFLLHSSGVAEGSSIAVLSIMRLLVEKGYNVLAVCPEQGELIDAMKEYGIETSIIRYAGATYPKIYTIKSFLSWPKRFYELLWYNHTAEKKLTCLVKQFKPDIIHTNVGVLRVGFYVAKKLGILHVWHIRETEKGLLFHHYPYRGFQEKLLINNDFNIAITENVKHYYHLTNDNTKVVYDGVFSLAYIPKTTDKKDNYFLFVGRILESKGADWAVDAFLKIAEQYLDVELWLAGPVNSPFAKSLINGLKDNSNYSRIKFLGPRSDIYDLMSRAKALLVSSVLEGFGFITVEAMLNKTIVIGRNTGGTKEQFDNGILITGHEIALRFDTVSEMAQHMSDVCKNGQKPYKKMIESAQQVVLQKYNAENNADQIENVYIDLLNR